MSKNRLEAFSDGVIAIIITIMVLELHAPHDGSLVALRPLGSAFLCYVLSFVFVGIYWNNHHHLLHAVERVNGKILWANMHLLFWLSLVPFVTGWTGENHFAPWPVAGYGVVMLMAGVAYYILTVLLIRRQRKDSPLMLAVGKDEKGIISVVIYAAAIPVAFWHAPVAFGMYVFVALIWFVPDSRIEKILNA